MRSLPSPDAGAMRRALLRDYVLACLRTNVLSWSDLTGPSSLVDKLAGVVAADAREVFSEIGKEGGAGGLRFVGAFLGQKIMDLADSLERGGPNKGKR